MLSSLSSGTYVYIRVRDRGLGNYTNGYYNLSFGTLIDDITDVSVDSDETLARMVFGTTSPYFPTQFHNTLDWTATILDSEGYEISGVKLVLYYATEDISLKTVTRYTDADGVVSDSISMPDCTGNHTVTHYYAYSPLTGTWETEYDVGGWYIEVPQARLNEQVGVSQVDMAHICSQTLQ